MDSIEVVGSGAATQQCRAVLGRAGFDLEADSRSASPLVVGECLNAFAVAWQALQARRHVMIASPQSLAPAQLGTLLGSRRPRQAIFLWGDRRYHPAYRLVGGLVEAGDSTWQPRYVRHTTLSGERPAAGLVRWRTIEALGLVFDLAAAAPSEVSASAVANAERQSADFVSLSVRLGDVAAYVQVGLGEGFERRETLVAGDSRKAYIDELNCTVPVRLVDDDPPPEPGGSARWVSCLSPAAEELARQQCLAFVEGMDDPALAAAEANLWQHALAAWRAAEASLSEASAPSPVLEPEQTGLRLLAGGRRATAPAAPHLRAISA